MVKKIFDNIHGFVVLNDDENQLINTAYFQRLRNIKQLGLVHYLYPSATHTRYSHSLGVLALSIKFIDAITLDLNKQLKDLNPRKNAQKRSIKTHLSNIETDSDNIKKAALLHDIGHPPLSHTVERAYAQYYALEKKKKEFSPGVDVQLKEIFENASAIKANLHEEWGEIIIRKIQKEHSDIISESELKKILDLFDKDKGGITQQIVSNTIDIDRIDYLIRDNYFLGANIVSFDSEFIFNCIRAHINDKDELEVCFSEKALQALEQLILARYHWYSQVIFYDKLLFYDYALSSVLCYLFLNWEKISALIPKLQNFSQFHPDNINELITDPQGFMSFNDSMIDSLLHLLVQNKSHFTSDKELNRFIKLVKIVYLKEETTLNKQDLHEKVLHDSLQKEDSEEHDGDEFYSVDIYLNDKKTEVLKAHPDLNEEDTVFIIAQKPIIKEKDLKDIKLAKHYESKTTRSPLAEKEGTLIKELSNKELRAFYVFDLSVLDSEN